MDVLKRIDWAVGRLGVDPAVIPPAKLKDVLNEAKSEIERWRTDYAAVTSLLADKDETIERLRSALAALGYAAELLDD
jgi:hypothetical protein